MAKRHGNAKDKVEIVCALCELAFFVIPARALTAKFCSRSCKTTKYSTGRKKTAEEIEKIRRAHLGKRHSPTTEYKSGQKRPDISGKNHYRWVSDRTQLKDDSRERGGQLHREWSTTVKSRDAHKCRIANEECSGRLEAHHILGWTEHPKLRYDVNNGITLCHFHHPRKREEEKRLSPYFQELISVSNNIL